MYEIIKTRDGQIFVDGDWSITGPFENIKAARQWIRREVLENTFPLTKVLERYDDNGVLILKHAKGREYYL